MSNVEYIQFDGEYKMEYTYILNMYRKYMILIIKAEYTVA